MNYEFLALRRLRLGLREALALVAVLLLGQLQLPQLFFVAGGAASTAAATPLGAGDLMLPCPQFEQFLVGGLFLTQGGRQF